MALELKTPEQLAKEERLRNATPEQRAEILCAAFGQILDRLTTEQAAKVGEILVDAGLRVHKLR